MYVYPTTTKVMLMQIQPDKKEKEERKWRKSRKSRKKLLMRKQKEHKNPSP